MGRVAFYQIRLPRAPFLLALSLAGSVKYQSTSHFLDPFKYCRTAMRPPLFSRQSNSSYLCLFFVKATALFFFLMYLHVILQKYLKFRIQMGGARLSSVLCSSMLVDYLHPLVYCSSHLNMHNSSLNLETKNI